MDLTYGGTSMLGVLLVDMNYSSIERILDKANTAYGFLRVCLSDGSGRRDHLSSEAGTDPDGAVSGKQSGGSACVRWRAGRRCFGGKQRIVTQKTISYTGWKLVSVVPLESFGMGKDSTRYLVIMLVSLALLATVILNQFVSARISKPLRRLNDSVREWEAGNQEPDIYVGGSLEVEHLGRTLRSTMKQIQELMQDIVVKQERRSERVSWMRCNHRSIRTFCTILWTRLYG